MKEKIMKLIADELGVEFGEEFELKEFTGVFKIEKDGVYYCDDESGWKPDIPEDYMNYEKEEVVRKPWIPKSGEECFVIYSNGIFYDKFRADVVSDVSKFALGGIYKTKQEAEAHREEFLDRLDRIMKGELVVKFEEVEK